MQHKTTDLEFMNSTRELSTSQEVASPVDVGGFAKLW